MSDLHTTINAEQLNSQSNPTPVPATLEERNATENTSNATWNTFVAPVGSPKSVVSSVLDNPGTVAGPPSGSPDVAPKTSDPALIITTADARKTYQWPDGSWRQYPVNLTAENLAYGTGHLYQNAGGFGGPVNNPGTYPPSPFNPPVAQH
jgi:hypothetical protein